MVKCDLCDATESVLRVELMLSDDQRPVLWVMLCTSCRQPLIDEAGRIAHRILEMIR